MPDPSASTAQLLERYRLEIQKEQETFRRVIAEAHNRLAERDVQSQTASLGKQLTRLETANEAMSRDIAANASGLQTIPDEVQEAVAPLSARVDKELAALTEQATAMVADVKEERRARRGFVNWFLGSLVAINTAALGISGFNTLDHYDAKRELQQTAAQTQQLAGVLTHLQRAQAELDKGKYAWAYKRRSVEWASHVDSAISESEAGRKALDESLEEAVQPAQKNALQSVKRALDAVYVDALAEKAKIQLENGEYSELVRTSDVIASVDEDSWYAAHYKGIGHYNLKQWEPARQSWVRSVNVLHTSGENRDRINLAELELRDGSFAPARDLLAPYRNAAGFDGESNDKTTLYVLFLWNVAEMGASDDPASVDLGEAFAARLAKKAMSSQGSGVSVKRDFLDALKQASKDLDPEVERVIAELTQHIVVVDS